MLAILYLVLSTRSLAYASNADSYLVRIGPGATYYQRFFEATLPLLFPGTSVEFVLENTASNACDQATNLTIRGWSKTPSACGGRTDVFVSSEPWDATSIESDLLITTVFAQALLPPRSASSILYLPFYSLSFSQRLQHSPQALLRPGHETPLSTRPGRFCAFLARNCIEDRLRLLRLLSAHEHVDALGSCGSDAPVNEVMHGFETVENHTYLDRAVEAYTGYRFVVCVENTRASGYITEKIVSAFLAGTIPIYIGAPDVAAHFDPESFVNCNEYSLEECASEVRRIDLNETLYRAMRNHPPLHENRLSAAFSWHPDVPNEDNTWTVPSALENYLASKQTSKQTCDSDVFQHTELLSAPPDVSLLWRPRTESAMTLFLRAERVCPSATLPPVKSRFGATCLITQPRRLQGFLGCEVGNAAIKDSEHTTSYVKGREVTSLEVAPTFHGNKCIPAPRSVNSSNVWLLVPEGSSCDHSSSTPTIENSSSPNTRISGLIVVQSAATTTSSMQKDETGNLPWVSISKVDASWLHHELTRGTPLEIEITFKPKFHLAIDALLAAAEANTSAPEDRKTLTSRAACVQHALTIGPLFKRINLAAAGICRELGNHISADAFEARASRLVL